MITITWDEVHGDYLVFTNDLESLALFQRGYALHVGGMLDCLADLGLEVL